MPVALCDVTYMAAEKEIPNRPHGPEDEVDEVLADWFNRKSISTAFPSDHGTSRPGDGTPGPGRPREIEVEVRLVYMLAAVGTSLAEIGKIVGCAPALLWYHYRDLIETARANLRARLRAAQVRTALDGNATMQIWLGKNLLGQYDESRLRITDLRGLSDDDLALLAEGKMPKALSAGDGSGGAASVPDTKGNRAEAEEVDYEIIEK